MTKDEPTKEEAEAPKPKTAKKRRTAMQNVNQEIRELKEQMEHLMAMMEKHNKKANGNGHSHHDDDSFLHVSREELAEMARKAGKDVRSFIKDKRGQAEDVYEDVEKQITHHPLQSMLAVLTGGLLLGMMMSRR